MKSQFLGWKRSHCNTYHILLNYLYCMAQPTKSSSPKTYGKERCLLGYYVSFSMQKEHNIAHHMAWLLLWVVLQSFGQMCAWIDWYGCYGCSLEKKTYISFMLFFWLGLELGIENSTMIPTSLLGFFFLLPKGPSQTNVKPMLCM
jgi:hypothetical protein